MIIKFRNILIFFVSLLTLIIFFYFSIINIIKKPTNIINFIDSDLHHDFEIEIANNLNDINNFVNDYLFIESHSSKKINNENNIKIQIKKPFALNKSTKEVIFMDNTKASIKYFKQNYLDKIKLIDISKNSIYLNRYLIDHYKTLFKLFSIDQIEYIDDRRYNLILNNGRIVMLPKVIDSKLLFFIENNIDLIHKNINYDQYLDLRNFHNKTIRLK